MEQYALLFSILFFGFAAASWIRFKNIVNPITLFCGVWGVSMMFYSFRLFHLYAASDRMMLLVVLGVCCFAVGGMAGSFPLVSNNGKLSLGVVNSIPARFALPNSLLSLPKKKRLDYMPLNIMNLVSLLFLCYFGLITISMLRRGYDYTYIRDMFMDESGDSVGSSALTRFVMTFLIHPWNYFIIPMSTVLFMIDKNKTKGRQFFLLTTITNVAAFVLVTGGRVSLVYYVMYFVIINLLAGAKIKLDIKQKVAVIVLAVAIVIAIILISNSRNSPPFLRNAYIYICGCMPFGSRMLPLYDKKFGFHSYGFSSFYGVWKVVLIPLSKLIGYPELYLKAMTSTFTQERIMIAPGQTFNAFVSLFYFFYADFGIIGVAVLSFLYGLISSAVYAKMMRKQSIEMLVIYCLLVYGLIFSLVRFQFSTARYVLSFIYTVLMFHLPLKIRVKN